MNRRCQYCNHTASNVTQLRAHYASVHPEATPYKCDHCDRAFKSFASCNRHAKECQSGPESGPESDFHAFLRSQELVEETQRRILAMSVPEFKDEQALEDHIDAWNVDNVGTFTKHLRYLRHHLVFRQKEDLLSYLDERIAKSQKKASQEEHRSALLNFLSPEPLVALREQIMEILRGKQKALDQELKSGVVSWDLLVALRNFLELSLRFVDVPLRIQCSISLTTAPIGVASLQKHPSGYVRVVILDKNQDSHDPIALPVPRVLQPYLSAYMQMRTELKIDSEFVFVNRAGHQWLKASSDLKEYLREAGFDPDRVDPSGRFVHGTRKIFLAVVGLVSDMDVNQMRRACVLMRSSLATAEEYYQVWSKMHGSRKALEFWREKVLGEDVMGNVNPKYKPSILNRAPDFLELKFRTSYSFPGEKVHYRTRDVGTQTDGAVEVDEGGTQICSSCNGELVLLGPVGDRESKYFARYFKQCVACSGKRPNKRRAIWLERDFEPSAGEKSASTKPRNMAAIEVERAKWKLDRT